MRCYFIQAGVLVGVLALVFVVIGLLSLLSELKVTYVEPYLRGALSQRANRVITRVLWTPIFGVALILFGILLWSAAGDITRKLFHWCVS